MSHYSCILLFKHTVTDIVLYKFHFIILFYNIVAKVTNINYKKNNENLLNIVLILINRIYKNSIQEFRINIVYSAIITIILKYLHWNMISIIHENKIRTNRGSCYLKMATLNRRKKYITKARTIAISSTNISRTILDPCRFIQSNLIESKRLSIDAWLSFKLSSFPWKTFN